MLTLVAFHQKHLATCSLCLKSHPLSISASGGVDVGFAIGLKYFAPHINIAMLGCGLDSCPAITSAGRGVDIGFLWK